MFDDLRIRVDIPHEHVVEFGMRSDGTRSRPQRIKKWGIANQSIRIKPVRSKDGTAGLVIEGSFNGFLNGQTVIGTMDLTWLVKQVVDKVLASLSILPTPSEQGEIDKGQIKLERMDVVGYLRIRHLGDAGTVLRALDVGLAGSRRNRMIFPRETVVYHSSSSYWSLMFYDKGQRWSQLAARMLLRARQEHPANPAAGCPTCSTACACSASCPRRWKNGSPCAERGSLSRAILGRPAGVHDFPGAAGVAHRWFQLSAAARVALAWSAGIRHPASGCDESSSLSGSSICPKNVLFFGRESRHPLATCQHRAGCPAPAHRRFEHRRRHLSQGAPREARYRVHTGAVCEPGRPRCGRQGLAAAGRAR